MLANQIAQQVSLKDVIKQGWTLQEAADIFLSTYPCAESSRNVMRQHLAKFRREFGSRQINSIAPLEIDRYFALRRDALQPTSYQHLAVYVRRFFKWCVRNLLVVTSPAEQIRVPYVRKSAGRCLSYAQGWKIIQNTPQHMRAQVFLAMDTGMRSADIARLAREQFDFGAKTVTFSISKTRDTVQRTLPLSARAVRALSEVPGTAGHLWPSAVHKKKWDIAKSNFVSRTREKVGFHFRYHDFRHTFYTRLAEASDPMLAAWAMGHSVQLAAQLYYHPSPEKVKEAFRKMEDATTEAIEVLQLTDMFEDERRT